MGEIKDLSKFYAENKVYYQKFPNEELIDKMCDKFGLAKPKFKSLIAFMVVNMEEDKMVEVPKRVLDEVIVMLGYTHDSLMKIKKLSFGSKRKGAQLQIDYLTEFISKLEGYRGGPLSREERDSLENEEL